MKLRELFDPVNQKSQPTPSVFDKINNAFKKPEANTPLKPSTQASATPKPAPAPAPVPAAEPTPFNPAEHKDLLIQTAKKNGITSDIDLSRLLGQANKETKFWKTPVENLNYITPWVVYKNFTRLFRPKMTPQQVDADPKVQSYLRNPVKLGTDGYAGVNGNGDANSGDGWKYRGRGFLQCTGRANYKLAGELAHPENPGIYLNNPDLLATDPKESALAAVKFFIKRVGKGASTAKASKGVSGHANQSAKQRQQLTQKELDLLRKQKTKPKTTK